MESKSRLTKDGQLITPTETRNAVAEAIRGILEGTHYVEVDGVKKYIKFDMTKSRTLTQTQVKQFSYIIILLDHKEDYEFHCKKLLKEIYPTIPSRSINREYQRAVRKKGEFMPYELVQ